MERSPCCSKVGLTRGAWTTAEDKILRDYIMVHGKGRWRELPKRAGLKRCGMSCRLRWLNYLRPDIKRGNISHDEEELIIRLHKLLGNRWSLIAGRLPGRTDNEIKNYWNTILRKKVQYHHNSASTCEHSNQSNEKDKKETGMSSQAIPKIESQLKYKSRVVRPKAVRCSKAYFSPQPQKQKTMRVEPTMKTLGELVVKESSIAIGVLPTIPEEDNPSNLMLDVDTWEVCLSDLLDSNHCNKNSNDLSRYWDGPLEFSEKMLENWTGFNQGCL